MEFRGTEFSCELNPKTALHFDLFFNVVESPKGLNIECGYNSDLFEPGTIERWLENYQTLLEGLIENVDVPLNALPVLTPAERTELIQARNQTARPFPAERLHEAFERFARQTPDATAVRFGDSSLTYGDLNRRANRLAHHLKGIGVGPDVLVGLCVERSLDMLVALLGFLKAGGAYVPLDPSFPSDRLAYMVEDSAMRVLITHRDLDKMLGTVPSKVIRLDADAAILESHSAENPTVEGADPTNVAYVLYTSGSTGKPKGVQIPHSAVVNFLASMSREPGFTAKDTLLAVTTLSFDIAGLELYLPLTTGGQVVIASREEALDPVRLMERMRESQCTVLQATPATWRALLDAGWKGSPQLKALCGGEALPSDLAGQLIPRCAELWNMYGPTETTIWSTVHHVTDANGAIPIGRPIDNTQVYILDANRNLAPDHAIGELCIGGDGLAQGYLNRAELTAERFIESPFEEGKLLYRTGDLARWNGGILECLGRIDNQVKVRGFRIELGEIEAILARHESVRHGVVDVRSDNDGDKRLVAYVEAQGGAAPSLADLRAYLGNSLPEYMLPSALVTLDRLPLTPNGKIDRKALPNAGGQVAEEAREFAAPTDALESTLAQLFAKVLKVKQVGVRDEFL